ncbi:MAG: hypothetical protein NTU61_05095 [Candidatus Altiarchaeota archaeon]|nr:hypothetical protein [Candidatus Altiarchaeota archaeon]
MRAKREIKRYLQVKKEILKLVLKEPLDKTQICKKARIGWERLDKILSELKRERKIRIRKVSYGDMVIPR